MRLRVCRDVGEELVLLGRGFIRNRPRSGLSKQSALALAIIASSESVAIAVCSVNELSTYK